MANCLKRVVQIGAQTFRENVVHNRWFQLSLFGLLLFVLGCRTLSGLPLGPSAPKLMFDVGQAVIRILSSSVLVILLSHQIMSEIQNGTVYSILVRCVRRPEYLLGKLLGNWFSVVISLVLAQSLLAAFVTVDARIWEGAVVPGMLGWTQVFLVHSVELLVLGFLVVCIVSFSRSFLFAALVTLAIWTAAMLLPGLQSPEASAAKFAPFLVDAMSWILPPVAMWNLSADIWYDGALGLLEVGRLVLLSAFYAALFFGFGSYLFNRRGL